MRAIWIVAGLVIGASAARAESVVVLAGQGDLDTALRVAMAGRGVDVTLDEGPAGAMRFERAAVAQHAAIEHGATAAVWIDDADVCAVTADGRDFRHAPYPRDAASPRTFAAIATSLLDEMMHPDWEPGVDVNVDVDLTVGGGRGVRVATAEPVPVPIDAPGMAPVPAPDGRAHEGQTLLEIGGMASPLTVGIQGAVAFPIAPAWRVAVTGAVNDVLDSRTLLGIGSVELRHVGMGMRKHWDIGPETGYATDGKDPAAFVGVRFARTWELSNTALSLAFTPLVVHPMTGDDTPWAFPAIYASLRLQVPL